MDMTCVQKLSTNYKPDSIESFQLIDALTKYNIHPPHLWCFIEIVNEKENSTQNFQTLINIIELEINQKFHPYQIRLKLITQVCIHTCFVTKNMGLTHDFKHEIMGFSYKTCVYAYVCNQWCSSNK